MGISKTFSEALIAAEQQWRAAEHIVRVTFPVVQDPKLLLHALEHLAKAARQIMSVILKREYLHQRVRLSTIGSENLEVFFGVCATRYKVSTENAAALRELLTLVESRRTSSMEFSQKGKVILVDDDFGTTIITVSHLAVFLDAVRNLHLELHRQLKDTRNI